MGQWGQVEGGLEESGDISQRPSIGSSGYHTLTCHTTLIEAHQTMTLCTFTVHPHSFSQSYTNKAHVYIFGYVFNALCLCPVTVCVYYNYIHLRACGVLLQLPVLCIIMCSNTYTVRICVSNNILILTVVVVVVVVIKTAIV